MAASAIVTISPEVEAVLRRSTVRNNVLYLPNEQLDRKLYEATNKVLNLLGGVWKSGKVKGHVFPPASDPGLLLEEALDSGELLDAKKHFQFFPTPPAVGAVVVAAAIRAGSFTVRSVQVISDPVPVYRIGDLGPVDYADSGERLISLSGFFGSPVPPPSPVPPKDITPQIPSLGDSNAPPS